MANYRTKASRCVASRSVCSQARTWTVRMMGGSSVKTPKGKLPWPWGEGGMGSACEHRTCSTQARRHAAASIPRAHRHVQSDMRVARAHDDILWARTLVDTLSGPELLPGPVGLHPTIRTTPPFRLAVTTSAPGPRKCS